MLGFYYSIKRNLATFVELKKNKYVDITYWHKYEFAAKTP